MAWTKTSSTCKDVIVGKISIARYISRHGTKEALLLQYIMTL
jgi:hypothetical protein